MHNVTELLQGTDDVVPTGCGMPELAQNADNAP